MIKKKLISWKLDLASIQYIADSFETVVPDIYFIVRENAGLLNGKLPILISLPEIKAFSTKFNIRPELTALASVLLLLVDYFTEKEELLLPNIKKTEKVLFNLNPSEEALITYVSQKLVNSGNNYIINYPKTIKKRIATNPETIRLEQVLYVNSVNYFAEVLDIAQRIAEYEYSKDPKMIKAEINKLQVSIIKNMLDTVIKYSQRCSLDESIYMNICFASELIRFPELSEHAERIIDNMLKEASAFIKDYAKIEDTERKREIIRYLDKVMNALADSLKEMAFSGNLHEKINKLVNNSELYPIIINGQSANNNGEQFDGTILEKTSEKLACLCKDPMQEKEVMHRRMKFLINVIPGFVETDLNKALDYLKEFFRLQQKYNLNDTFNFMDMLRLIEKQLNNEKIVALVKSEIETRYPEKEKCYIKLAERLKNLGKFDISANILLENVNKISGTGYFVLDNLLRHYYEQLLTPANKNLKADQFGAISALVIKLETYLDMEVEDGDYSIYCCSLTQLGDFFYDQGMPERAQSYYNRALKYLDKFKPEEKLENYGPILRKSGLDFILTHEKLLEKVWEEIQQRYQKIKNDKCDQGFWKLVLDESKAMNICFPLIREFGIIGDYKKVDEVIAWGATKIKRATSFKQECYRELLRAVVQRGDYELIPDLFNKISHNMGFEHSTFLMELFEHKNCAEAFLAIEKVTGKSHREYIEEVYDDHWITFILARLLFDKTAPLGIIKDLILNLTLPRIDIYNFPHLLDIIKMHHKRFDNKFMLDLCEKASQQKKLAEDYVIQKIILQELRELSENIK
ncbi:MAG: hypothetical protein PHV30_04205 [Candidatus Margulisbacteria bacterium]|nr:hypothetical protein [Candidatus Margulisiibacteriota bacterium]